MSDFDIHAYIREDIRRMSDREIPMFDVDHKRIGSARTVEVEGGADVKITIDDPELLRKLKNNLLTGITVEYPEVDHRQPNFD